MQTGASLRLVFLHMPRRIGEGGAMPDPRRTEPAAPSATGMVPRALAFDALSLADEAGAHVRDALASLFEQRRIDRRDRDLAAEIAHGVIRREDTLDAVLTLRLKRPVAEQDARVLRVLRIGVYQMLFLDRVPRSAAVTTSVELVRAAGRDRATGLVNAVLRAVAGLVGEVRPAAEGDTDLQRTDLQRTDPRRTVPRGDGRCTLLTEPAFADPESDLAEHLAGRYGAPRWAVARFLAQHGRDAAYAILEASIARPSVALRPRGGRGPELEAALAAAGIGFEAEGPCLLVRGSGDVRGLPLWDAGAYTVQDPTAAEVAADLGAGGALRGATVLDLCAAPGGKTLGLSDLVGPEGRVVAVDVPGPRTMQMIEELARRRVANVEMYSADATDASALPRRPAAGAAGTADGFDVVLVDAPCSNSGVLARRVEARRRLRDGAALASLVAVQSRLLDAAATRVRPGGRLAWSTCSLDDEENGARVRAFLASHPGFTLVSERTTLPVAGRRDGGHLSVLAAASVV